MILIGLALFAFGAWLATLPGNRIFAIGFFFTAAGNILFGVTNGFTNMTPLGHKLFRLALAAYAVGIPFIAYFLFREMTSK
jgi:hypothetical protein